MDVEHEVLFLNLVNFANDGPANERDTKSKWFAWVAPKGKDEAAAFFSDVAEAQDLTKTALTEIAQREETRRNTETRLNKYLANVREKRLYAVKQGEIGVYVIYDMPTAASYCAYLLASIIEGGLAGIVICCRLRECKQLAWKPKKRGQRPKYCSEQHRLRDAQRQLRGST